MQEEEGRNESLDQLRLEAEDFERHLRSGPHRVRADRRLRRGRRGRCHAGGRHQHQHGLQQSIEPDGCSGIPDLAWIPTRSS